MRSWAWFVIVLGAYGLVGASRAQAHTTRLRPGTTESNKSP